MAIKPSLPANIPLSAISTGSQNLVNAWKEYKTTREQEITKREQIRSNRDIALEQIKAQAETLRALIEGTFSERSKNFDLFFQTLEAGFSSGDDKKINAALALIVAQTKTSPMAQAVQLISKINDKDDSDVIEI